MSGGACPEPAAALSGLASACLHVCAHAVACLSHLPSLTSPISGSCSLTLAVEYLEKGVACKYTAADAVKGLNQIFQQLLDSTPQHAPGGWVGRCSRAQHADV